MLSQSRSESTLSNRNEQFLLRQTKAKLEQETERTIQRLIWGLGSSDGIKLTLESKAESRPTLELNTTARCGRECARVCVHVFVRT